MYLVSASLEENATEIDVDEPKINWTQNKCARSPGSSSRNDLFACEIQSHFYVIAKSKSNISFCLPLRSPRLSACSRAQINESTALHNLYSTGCKLIYEVDSDNGDLEIGVEWRAVGCRDVDRRASTNEMKMSKTHYTSKRWTNRLNEASERDRQLSLKDISR